MHGTAPVSTQDAPHPSLDQGPSTNVLRTLGFYVGNRHGSWFSRKDSLFWYLDYCSLSLSLYMCPSVSLSLSLFMSPSVVRDLLAE